MAKPELRPAEVLPTRSASSSRMLLSGQRSASRRAAAKPVKPAPIITTSAFRFPRATFAGARGGRISNQPLFLSN